MMEATGVDEKILIACEVVYMTSFLHGYKHALEDAEASRRVFSESGGLGGK